MNFQQQTLDFCQKRICGVIKTATCISRGTIWRNLKLLWKTLFFSDSRQKSFVLLAKLSREGFQTQLPRVQRNVSGKTIFSEKVFASLPDSVQTIFDKVFETAFMCPEEVFEQIICEIEVVSSIDHYEVRIFFSFAEVFGNGSQNGLLKAQR